MLRIDLIGKNLDQLEILIGNKTHNKTSILTP